MLVDVSVMRGTCVYNGQLGHGHEVEGALSYPERVGSPKGRITAEPKDEFDIWWKTPSKILR